MSDPGPDQARCLLTSSDYIPCVDMDATTEALCQKVWDGERVSGDEAARLYELPLPQLGTLADRRRHLAKADAYDGRGNEIATYNIDRNINYTNVCTLSCAFCAFSKGPAAESLRGKPYLLAMDEISRRTAEAWARGATEVCMQGGIHPDFTGADYLEILNAAKAGAEVRLF